MTEKTVKYTDAIVEQMQSIYDPTAEQAERIKQVDELIELTGFTKASIVGKLCNMKLYVGVHDPKTKAPIVTKDALVEHIAEAMQLHSEQLIGLEKANKSTLLKILACLENYQDA